MSFDITPIQPAQVSAPARTPSAPPRAPAPAEIAPAPDPVKNDTIPASPPPEVLDAMSVASAQHDHLTASGRGLSFKIDDATGRLIISVHDTHGRVLFTVPPAKVLEFASGGSLD
jgi:hypothetical protein